VKSLTLCCPQDPLQAEDPVPFVANVAYVAGDAYARLVLSMNVAAYCLVAGVPRKYSHEQIIFGCFRCLLRWYVAAVRCHVIQLHSVGRT